jgi:hypothetical protein
MRKFLLLTLLLVHLPVSFSSQVANPPDASTERSTSEPKTVQHPCAVAVPPPECGIFTMPGRPTAPRTGDNLIGKNGLESLGINPNQSPRERDLILRTPTSPILGTSGRS